MRQLDSAERTAIQVVDYSLARAKAIAWLGDRYLLAKPINRSSNDRHYELKRQPAGTATDRD